MAQMREQRSLERRSLHETVFGLYYGNGMELLCITVIWCEII
jgi:hypothetical protein